MSDQLYTVLSRACYGYLTTTKKPETKTNPKTWYKCAPSLWPTASLSCGVWNLGLTSNKPAEVQVEVKKKKNHNSKVPKKYIGIKLQIAECFLTERD